MSIPRGVRVSEDFVPVSEFKAAAADWLKRLTDTNVPLVVTQHGRPAGVLLSPRAFDELTERAHFVAALHQGLDDVERGRVHDHAEVKQHMKKRFARNSR